jgi:hypothetical protein
MFATLMRVQRGHLEKCLRASKRFVVNWLVFPEQEIESAEVARLYRFGSPVRE